MFKRCSKCLVTKPLEEFGRRKISTDGLNGHCRKCIALKNKQWKKENPIRYLCSMMLAQAKRRAINDGRDFNLTLEDVVEVVVVECPVLKTPLRWEYQHGVGRADERSPSLDRIDNSRGYIKGNIAIISHRANSIKNCLTINQIKSLFEYVSLPQQGAVGQLRPVVKKPKYTRMSQEEMQLIRDLHSKGWGCRKIAAVVTQSKSSVAAFIRQERSC